MISLNQFECNLKVYINTQLEQMSKTTPVINFIKPLVKRALDKNINKVTKVLDLITDNNGNLDIEQIISEMTQSVVNSNTFNINTQFIGNIEIGNGEIKFNIPFTDKRLVLTMDDIENFKNIITSKE